MFANLHVRKDATFANFHSHTHAYCSFVLLNEAIPMIVSGAFFFPIRFTGKKIWRVENNKNNTSKWHPNSSTPPKIWHPGDLYVANKELEKL